MSSKYGIIYVIRIKTEKADQKRADLRDFVSVFPA